MDSINIELSDDEVRDDTRDENSIPPVVETGVTQLVKLDTMTDDIMMFEEDVQEKDTYTLSLGSSPSKHAPSDIRSNMDVDPHPYSSSKIAKVNSTDVDILTDNTVLTQSSNVTSSKFKSPKKSKYNTRQVTTKYNAIICLNKNLQLKDEVVSRDQRSIATHVINSSGDTIVSIINIYAPASLTARSLFFTCFPDLPFLNYITADVPGFVLRDFNMSSPTTTGTTDWEDWISTNFFNCFPAGSTTFQRGSLTRTTIDLFLGILHSHF
ncbi:hypothetical protein BD770DRAFT_456336 [Pilaira anomala]|nr:hypothetical protein BD770DRAFT_456336 [Pilaira anomala]